MAKKNAKFTDPTSSSVLLDGRTRAVMANPTHQDEAKHKIQQVREVVPVYSNHDIYLALQYYDFDLERTTQAFLEDGAKEALEEWKFSGNKPVTKKKKKGKTKGKDVTTLTTTSTTVSTATSSSSSSSAQVTKYATSTSTTMTTGGPPIPQDQRSQQSLSHNSINAVHAQLPQTATQDNITYNASRSHDFKSDDFYGHTNGVVTNGVLNHLKADFNALGSKYSGLDVQMNGINSHNDCDPLPLTLTDHHNDQSAHSNHHSLSVSSAASTLSNLSNNHILLGENPDLKQPHNDHSLSVSSAASTLSSLSTSLESSPVNNHIPPGGKPDLKPHSIVNNHSSLHNNSSSKQTGKPRQQQYQQQQQKSRSRSRDTAAAATDKGGRPVGSPSITRKAEGMKLKVTRAEEMKLKVMKAEEKKNKYSNETMKSSGGEQHYTARPKTLAGKTRERTISEMSMSSVTTTSTITGDTDTKSHHKDHRGLEKSMKDLQRQLTSLQRHRNILDEDCDKSVKNIEKVFEQLRELVLDREAQLNLKMDHLKKQATDTLAARQQQGLALKARTDKAYKMTDYELVELRADIKHFVSERKVDEDIANQKKCILDFEELKTSILQFGEIPELKHHYSTRRPSLSSSISSTMTDPLSPVTPVTPYTPSPVTPNLLHVVPPPSKKPTPPTVSAPIHPHTLGAKVVSQSESLTKFEVSEEMQTLLLNRKENASKPGPSRRSQTPAGRARSQGRNNPSSRGGTTSGAQTKGASVSRQQKPLPGGGGGGGDTTDDSLSMDEKKMSRNARRRQRQRERQKEMKVQQKNGDTVVVNPTKSSSQGQSKVTIQGQPPKKEGQGQQPKKNNREGQVSPTRRNYRTPSPTKRTPRVTEATNMQKNGPHDNAPKEHKSGPHGDNKEPNDSTDKDRVSQRPEKPSTNQQQVKGSRSPMGRGRGRGGQRSRSTEYRISGSHNNQMNHSSKSRPDNRRVIPEGEATGGKTEVKTGQQNNNAVNGTVTMVKESSDNATTVTMVKEGSNDTVTMVKESSDTTVTMEKENSDTTVTMVKENSDNTPTAKPTTDGSNVSVITKETSSSVTMTTNVTNDNETIATKDTVSVEDSYNKDVVNGNVSDAEISGDKVFSSNNNNNKLVGSKNQRNSTIGEHYYDSEDEQNSNSNAVIKEMKIEEHIYDEALPQRKPRNRVVRKPQEQQTEINNVKDVNVVNEEVTVTQEVHINGSVNGEHRWSNERLDQIR